MLLFPVSCTLSKTHYFVLAILPSICSAEAYPRLKTVSEESLHNQVCLGSIPWLQLTKLEKCVVVLSGRTFRSLGWHTYPLYQCWGGLCYRCLHQKPVYAMDRLRIPYGPHVHQSHPPSNAEQPWHCRYHWYVILSGDGYWAKTATRCPNGSCYEGSYYPCNRLLRFL